MPYANGPLHIGHLAGAHLPPDIHSRWLGLVIGRENVLFVCGTDEHGSTTELAAAKRGVPIAEHLDGIHSDQQATLASYSIGLDTYSGTSRPECLPFHKDNCAQFFDKALANGLLSKRTSQQWFDPKMQRFLPDRFVCGKCPNPKCDNASAYSDECDVCGSQHGPMDLIEPRSTLSDATPERRDTVHLWLNMWETSETLASWLDSRKKAWRPAVYTAVRDTIYPALSFEKIKEPAYKELKASLPKHKLKYAAGGQVVLRFMDKASLATGQKALLEQGIDSELSDGWAHRSITRDLPWGVPAPAGDPELEGKTLYVWPESLLAPIAFSQVALQQRGEDPARYADFWRSPDSRIYQFLGQDNVFFYTLMQGSMWLSMQDDPHRLPIEGELQMSDVLGCFHLLVAGEKMSKSRGNFFTGDQVLQEKGYECDQVRYYLALLGLPEKQSDFDFDKLDERNRFLAGPMNAAFERPQSASRSKFGGIVPAGKLVDKIEADTVKMVQRYVTAMQKASYPSMLFELENYARKINSLFTQYKPHDDRHPEESRADALFSCFYVLKNLMIMLYPFVPNTMQRLRGSLKLPADVFSIDQLGTGIEGGHQLGEQVSYFPQPTAADADS